MCNLSVISQLLRILLGLALIAAAYFGPQTSILKVEWMNLWMLGWLGIFPLISGIAAFCPVYAIFGRDHQHKKKHKDPQ